MIIVHPYNDAVRAADHRETWEFLRQFEKERDYPVVHVKTDGFASYSEVLAAMWRLREDFIVIEHDIVPTESQLIELIACKEPLCTSWYWMYEGTTGLKEPTRSIRNVKSAILEANRIVVKEWETLDRFKPHEIEGRHCDIYATGLTKFTKKVTNEIPPEMFYDPKQANRPDYWKQTDLRMALATYQTGFKAHVHSEVKHNHK